MSDHFLLESENFRLSLHFRVFESDISYPNNTTLSVSVSSAGFAALSSMDIDVKEIKIFCVDLKKIYDTFKGEAKIGEPYGKQYIMFSCDKLGHIFISGLLHSGGANGFWQELKFENAVDQTFLLHFLKDLTTFSQRFVS